MRGKVLGAVALATLVLGTLPAAHAQSPFAVRLGAYSTSNNTARKVAGNNGAVIGVQYTVAGFPSLLNGEAWSTTISADFAWNVGEEGLDYRAIPVSINQVYTFEEQSGKTPYAGFSLTAVTFSSKKLGPDKPWLTRYGVGLILGLNLNDKTFIEGRYDMFNKHNIAGVPTGFKAVLGYRF